MQPSLNPPALPGFGSTLIAVLRSDAKTMQLRIRKPIPRDPSYWDDGAVHAWARVQLDDDAVPSDRCRPVLARPLSSSPIRSAGSGQSSIVRCSCGAEISALDRAESIAVYATHVSLRGGGNASDPATARALEIAIGMLDLAIDRIQTDGPSAVSLVREIRDLISFPRIGAEP